MQQYLEPAAKATQVAVSSSPPTQELPPLIRRFPKPDKGVELLFSGDHQQPSQEVSPAISPAYFSQLTYNSLPQPDTETMAPSDSVMADLAGLMIEPSATVIKASSTPPATLPGHDDQPVGVLVSESRAIDRIQDLLGDNNTSISSRQKPEKEHVKTVAPTAQGASRNPKPAMPQAAKPRTSSALFRGPVTAESITIVGPPSVMAPGSRLPRAYDLTRATPPRPQLPPEAEQPDWMHKSATDVIKERQQQTRSAPVRAQAPAKPSSKGKGKEREGSTIGQQAPPTTAPTTTPAGFRQWHAAQAQHKSAEESTKGKGKMYGGDFW